MNIRKRVGSALVAACISAAGSLAAPIPPKLPVEDFIRFPVAGGVAVSPDGKTMAYEMRKGDDWLLVFQDWDTGKLVTTRNGAMGFTPVWLNTERVVYGDGSSMDRDGNNRRKGYTTGWQSQFLFARFKGNKANGFLAENYEGNVMLIQTRDDIAQVRPFATNPGHVTKWLVDGNGFVRAAMEETKDGGQTRVIVRADENGPWTVPAGLDFANDKIRAQWLSADGKTLFLTKVTPEGTWGVYTYDLEKQQEKEQIISHTKYDIFPAYSVLAPATREVLGFYYFTDREHAVWFNPLLDDLQQALDQILPGATNEISSMSDDLQHMVIFSSSSRDPGKYYQFDLAKKSLKPLYPLKPWIKREQMAEMYPINYQSRDGLTIHGYLTVPAGREPKQLPMVVLPHPELFSRYAWSFDSNVQFLANRGYAVLQVNPRGTVGYGEAFKEKGYRKIGREVQDDITDGTRWAIEQGIADPKRIAIVGYGFGGYSALMGVIRNPGLYQCAVSIGGTTNWMAKTKYTKPKDVRADYKEIIGDPVKEAAELADISPINHVDQITAPVFVAYDNRFDFYVDIYDDYSAFAKALKKMHKNFEVMDIHNDRESLYEGKNHLELFNKVDAFLAKYVPTDVSNAPVATPAK